MRGFDKNSEGDAMQPETPPINPYGAPQAPVGDYVAGGHAMREHARLVPADHGVAWYRQAWRLFKLSPGVWIGIWAAFMGIVVVVSLLPMIGGLIVGVATPLFVGGAMIAARNARNADGARFADLFAAFSGRAGTLLLIGLLQLAASFAAGVLMMLVATLSYDSSWADGSFEQMLGNAEAIMPLIIMGGAIGLVFVPITNAVWLASGLAALDGAGAMDALRRAFGATFRNILALLVFVLVTLALAVAATIPIALGWLVLGPMMLCAVYAQFEDLFDATDEQAQE